eukprot:2226768-Amphidinium_carterae.1
MKEVSLPGLEVVGRTTVQVGQVDPNLPSSTQPLTSIQSAVSLIEDKKQRKKEEQMEDVDKRRNKCTSNVSSKWDRIAPCTLQCKRLGLGWQ